MKLLIILTAITMAAAHPGLLRVPKVYNAVITSNQNLSPSRAFPVIQPVIHRTAVGYVPPFYYTQISPHFSGPEVVHLPQSNSKPDESDVQTSASAESSKGNESKEKEETTERSQEGSEGNPKRKNEEPVPLNFYPNYQSLYYDPYFYAYNGFNPHFVPGTYYVDYQPYGGHESIPAKPPSTAPAPPEHLLPGYNPEENKKTVKEEKEKIPDVPPPPLPTSGPKSS